MTYEEAAAIKTLSPEVEDALWKQFCSYFETDSFEYLRADAYDAACALVRTAPVVIDRANELAGLWPTETKAEIRCNGQTTLEARWLYTYIRTDGSLEAIIGDESSTEEFDAQIAIRRS